jgi:DnaJ-class molecular chaperone
MCRGVGEVAGPQAMSIRVPPGVREGARFRFSVMPPGAPATVIELRISIR